MHDGMAPLWFHAKGMAGGSDDDAENSNPMLSGQG